MGFPSQRFSYLGSKGCGEEMLSSCLGSVQLVDVFVAPATKLVFFVVGVQSFHLLQTSVCLQETSEKNHLYFQILSVVLNAK